MSLRCVAAVTIALVVKCAGADGDSGSTTSPRPGEEESVDVYQAVRQCCDKASRGIDRSGALIDGEFRSPILIAYDPAPVPFSASSPSSSGSDAWLVSSKDAESQVGVACGDCQRFWHAWAVAPHIAPHARAVAAGSKPGAARKRRQRKTSTPPASEREQADRVAECVRTEVELVLGASEAIAHAARRRHQSDAGADTSRDVVDVVGEAVARAKPLLLCHPSIETAITSCADTSADNAVGHGGWRVARASPSVQVHAALAGTACGLELPWIELVSLDDARTFLVAAAPLHGSPGHDGHLLLVSSGSPAAPPGTPLLATMLGGKRVQLATLADASNLCLGLATATPGSLSDDTALCNTARAAWADTTTTTTKQESERSVHAVLTALGVTGLSSDAASRTASTESSPSGTGSADEAYTAAVLVAPAREGCAALVSAWRVAGDAMATVARVEEALEAAQRVFKRHAQATSTSPAAESESLVCLRSEPRRDAPAEWSALVREQVSQRPRTDSALDAFRHVLMSSLAIVVRRPPRPDDHPTGAGFNTSSLSMAFDNTPSVQTCGAGASGSPTAPSLQRRQMTDLTFVMVCEPLSSLCRSVSKLWQVLRAHIDPPRAAASAAAASDNTLSPDGSCPLHAAPPRLSSGASDARPWAVDADYAREFGVRIVAIDASDLLAQPFLQVLRVSELPSLIAITSYGGGEQTDPVDLAALLSAGHSSSSAAMDNNNNDDDEEEEEEDEDGPYGYGRDSPSSSDGEDTDADADDGSSSANSGEHVHASRVRLLLQAGQALDAALVEARRGAGGPLGEALSHAGLLLRRVGTFGPPLAPSEDRFSFARVAREARTSKKAGVDASSGLASRTRVRMPWTLDAVSSWVRRVVEDEALSRLIESPQSVRARRRLDGVRDM